MPITSINPFKGRHFPGEVILLCVRWYLRYPLAYQHVAELLSYQSGQPLPGGKCLDYETPWPGTGATVFLNDCAAAAAHSILVREINDRHDVRLYTGDQVIGISNASPSP